jgi:hypothetical protein
VSGTTAITGEKPVNTAYEELTDSLWRLSDDEIFVYWAALKRGFLKYPQPSTELMRVYTTVRVLENRTAVLVFPRLNCTCRVLVVVPRVEWLKEKIDVLDAAGAWIDDTNTEGCFVTALVASHTAEAVARDLAKGRKTK